MVAGRSPIGCVLVVKRSFHNIMHFAMSPHRHLVSTERRRSNVTSQRHRDQNVTSRQRHYNVILFAGRHYFNMASIGQRIPSPDEFVNS